MSINTTDVLIIDPDPDAHNHFEVWVTGKGGFIKPWLREVEGVSSIDQDFTFPEMYRIYVDRRYDMKQVKENVGAKLAKEMGGHVEDNAQEVSQGEPDFVDSSSGINSAASQPPPTQG
jgi:hypothetical protein